jgi:predicted acetyltransferase
MDIQIQKAVYADKSVLRNLLELCQHDYSEFNGQDVNEHGRFEYTYLDNYWTEPGRYPFLIKSAGKLVGFALVRILSQTDGERTYSMAEFFILRKYRGKGFGRQAAVRLFDMFPGRWRVSQEPNNFPARAFWHKVINGYTKGNFTEIPEGPIQEFNTFTKGVNNG